LTNSGKLSFVREATSDADATAAETRPKANAENVRMLRYFKVRGGQIGWPLRLFEGKIGVDGRDRKWRWGDLKWDQVREEG